MVRSAIVYTKQGERDVAFIVPTRNVSSGGIAFLHSQMMHVGQPCVVQLATKDGSFIMVPGKVLRCNYVKQMMHEVAIQFDKPIDVSLLLTEPRVQKPSGGGAEQHDGGHPSANEAPSSGNGQPTAAQ